MVEDRQVKTPRRVTLFVCSDCDRCARAAPFCREWVKRRPHVALDIVPVRQRPDQLVRLGVTHTPALVVEDEVLAQNVSIDRLAELLQTHLGAPETGAPA